MTSALEEAMEAALVTLGAPDEFESWNLDSGNLASFIAAYEAKLAEKGLVRVPKPQNMTRAQAIALGTIYQRYAGSEAGESDETMAGHLDQFRTLIGVTEE